jgi:hypothetical protein
MFNVYHKGPLRNQRYWLQSGTFWYTVVCSTTLSSAHRLPAHWPHLAASCDFYTNCQQDTTLHLGVVQGISAVASLTRCNSTGQPKLPSHCLTLVKVCKARSDSGKRCLRRSWGAFEGVFAASAHVLIVQQVHGCQRGSSWFL